MNKYKNILEILFKHVSVTEILEKEKLMHGVTCQTGISKNTFQILANCYMNNFSNDEIDNLYSYLIDYMEQSKDRIYGMSYIRKEKLHSDKGELNVFDVLLFFAEAVLMEKGGEPVCKYQHLLLWREISYVLDEELFVTAYLAYRDMYLGRKFRDFRWNIVMGTNNVALQQLLEKGIAENHFHLKGSAPYFHLSWLSLMNDVTNARFKSLLNAYDSHRLSSNVSYNPNYNEIPLYIRYRQAALIRLFLFAKLKNQRFVLGKFFVSKAFVKANMDYDLLSSIVLKKEEILNNNEKRFNEYGAVRVSRLIDYEKINNKLKEVQSLKNLFRIFSEYFWDRQFVSKLPDEISLADIIEILMSDNRQIPLEYLEGLIEQGIYDSTYDRCMKKRMYEILREPELMLLYLSEIQEQIHMEQYELQMDIANPILADYAIPRETAGYSDEKNAKGILSGERWIMYRMFQKIYEGDKKYEDLQELFYMYIIIKENIRSELIQVNNKVGFSNFSIYESRKEDFIEDTPFEHNFLKMAVRDEMIKGNIKSLEARITPRMRGMDDIRYIMKCDKKIGLAGMQKYRVYYVWHFIKEKEKEHEITSNIYCHHYTLRKKVKRQAAGIAKMRETNIEMANRVLGIDACNSEIYCRPEVFAQAFRFLKNHMTVRPLVFESYSEDRKDKEKNVMVRGVPELGCTYHAGEDFLDIVDGLRAIDEAILFLQMKCGDRLGHALALGTDVKEWYALKDRRIHITKQAYLDNIVWLHVKIRELGASGFGDVLLHLEKEYHTYFNEIYGDSVSEQYILEILKEKEKKERELEGKINSNNYNGKDNFTETYHSGLKYSFDINGYYEAWKLRGDNPECYIDGYFNQGFIGADDWNLYQTNDLGTENKNRYDFETSLLYHLYHYNVKVKENGAKHVEVKIPNMLIRAIELVQMELQKKVAVLGIGIETNPSSNYHIGTFKRYDKHPLMKFYNIGLEYNEEQIKSCPQISVSINTDDQGVFATSLENEYALILLALEKMRDDNGVPYYWREQIYQWMDNIREHGLKQSFLRNVRNEE